MNWIRTSYVLEGPRAACPRPQQVAGSAAVSTGKDSLGAGFCSLQSPAPSSRASVRDCDAVWWADPTHGGGGGFGGCSGEASARRRMRWRAGNGGKRSSVSSATGRRNRGGGGVAMGGGAGVVGELGRQFRVYRSMWVCVCGKDEENWVVCGL